MLEFPASDLDDANGVVTSDGIKLDVCLTKLNQILSTGSMVFHCYSSIRLISLVKHTSVHLTELNLVKVTIES